jgi:[ribosomal protein S5]-alanine N-acetyltransferase
MLIINFNPFPELYTARLHLRQLNNSDVENIFKLRSCSTNMQYIPRPLAKNFTDAQEHIDFINAKTKANEAINWAITIKGNTALIGVIGFYRTDPENYRAEVGYMLLPAFQKKGYLQEALETIVTYGFNVLQLHSIEARIDPRNKASEKVLEKVNFIKEAYLKENCFFEGIFFDTIIYSILKK